MHHLISDRLLIQFETNWADEIDIQGFHVISRQAWEFFQKTLSGEDFPLSLGVGSNQEINYETPNEFWKCFHVQPVSGVVSTILQSRFKLPFGQFPMEQILQGIIEDQPERGIQNEAWLMAEILPDFIL